MQFEVPTTPTGQKKKFAVYDLIEDQPPTTFHEAAEKGAIKFLIRMIERNVDFDINQRDRYNRTALHWAAEMGQLEAAETLLDFGIDALAAECYGRTAVHLAARSGDVDMLKVVVKAIPERKRIDAVNQSDNYTMTPVFLALQKGDEGRAAFEYLMSCGAKYNASQQLPTDPVPAGVRQ